MFHDATFRHVSALGCYRMLRFRSGPAWQEVASWNMENRSEVVPVAHTLHHADHSLHRQTHHREIVAAHPLDQRCAITLDAIRARLVHRLTGTYVRFRRQPLERAKLYVYHFDLIIRLSARRGNSDPGRDLVRAALEPQEHLHRVFLRPRFAENIRIHHNYGITADDDRIRARL